MATSLVVGAATLSQTSCRTKTVESFEYGRKKSNVGKANMFYRPRPFVCPISVERDPSVVSGGGVLNGCPASSRRPSDIMF